MIGPDYASGDGGTGGAREGAGVDAGRGYNLLSTGTMVEMLGIGDGRWAVNAGGGW